MREITFKKKDLLDVNNQGNVLILGLIILQIILIISINFNLNLDHLTNINQIDPTLESVKIRVIQRIEYEFRNNKIKDFEMQIEDYHVEVIYDVDRCDVIIDGEYHLEMKVVYDIVFWALGSVEYDYEYWEQ